MILKQMKRLIKLTKQHKKLSLVALVAFLIVGTFVGVAAKNASDKRTDAARNKYFGEQRHLELVRGCKNRIGKNTIDQVYGSWDYERNRYSLKIEASVATNKIPEVYVDDKKVEFDPDLVSEDVKFTSGYDCEYVKDVGSYYSLTVTMPATCNEKKAKLKTDDYEVAARVDNNGHECKSKEQQEAEKKEKAEREAREKAEAAQREADEAKKRAEEESRKQELQRVENEKANAVADEDALLDAEMTCARYAERLYKVKDVNVHFNYSSIKRRQDDGSLLIKANIADSQGISRPEKPIGIMECVTDPTGMTVRDFFVG
jgi:hypothetical protein